jgi:hypothetical protein
MEGEARSVRDMIREGRRKRDDGKPVFPYRNTAGEYPSDIREWLDQRSSFDGIEQVRSSDSPRDRAIMALAQLDAEYVGLRWDSLPWRSDDDNADQMLYVMHAVTRISYLVEHGFVVLPRSDGDNP